MFYRLFSIFILFIQESIETQGNGAITTIATNKTSEPEPYYIVMNMLNQEIQKSHNIGVEGFFI